jgi:hypothetical protein
VLIALAMVLLIVPFLYSTPAIYAASTTYYVSTSDGNDNNNGTSADTPWETLTRASEVTLSAGDQILLKCGDIFTDGLYPQGSGTAENPIIIKSYGTGNKPIISVGYTHKEVNNNHHEGWYCIKLIGYAGYKIMDLEFCNSACGISAWYNNTFNNDYIWIENCYFHDMTNDSLCWPSGKMANGDNALPAEDIQTPTGVAIAGVDGSTNPGDTTVLKNVTIKNCNFSYVDTGFCSQPTGFKDAACTSTEGYMHNTPVYGVTDDYFDNVQILGCTFYRNYRSAAAYMNATGNSLIQNCTFDENGYQKGFWWGTAAVQLVRNKSTVVDNCIIQNERAPQGFDGEAIDFEPEDDSCGIKNSTMQYCAGPSALSLETNSDWPGWTGQTVNCYIDNCVIRENDGSEAFALNTGSGGNIVKNSSIYLQNDSQSYNTGAWAFASSNQVWNKSGVKVYPVMRNPYTQVEAESYDSKNGTIDAISGNGGTVIENWTAGDYMVFNNMEFGTGGASSLQARVATGQNNVQIQFRLDNPTGTLVGTIPVPNNGWDSYSTETCNVSNATGTHDLYVVMTPGLSNINWFNFIESGGVPGSFDLITPSANATGTSTKPNFTWGTSSGATSYTLRVSIHQDRSDPVINQDVGNVTSYTSSTALDANTSYYWDVKAVNGGSSTYSNNYFMFTTGDGGTYAMGNNSEGTSVDNGSANDINACRYTADSSFTATKIKIKMNSAFSGHFKIAIYSHDSANNRPNTMLRSTIEYASLSVGWNTLNLTDGLSLTGDTTYWIVEWADAAYHIKCDTSGGVNKWGTVTYSGTWPAGSQISAGPGSNNDCIYASN